METIVTPGDKLHVLLRRRFEGEPRRHFAGTVESAAGGLALVEGHAFLYDSTRNEFRRTEGARRRVVALADAGNIVNVLPDGVDIEKLTYRMVEGGRYVITDGASFRMEVNEFGVKR